MRPSVLAGALALALAALQGCADGTGPGADGAAGQGTPVFGSTGQPGLPGYLSLTDGVLDAARFRGVRRLKQVHDVPSGPPEVLEIREEVAADGQGACSIDLLEVLSLPTTLEKSLFPVTHARSKDVYWRLRDFRLRGLSRVARNYAVTEAPGTRDVAGHSCRRVEFQRLQPLGDRPGHYVADVDPDTGFVLAVREYGDAGKLLQEMVYESLSYQPDLHGLELDSGTFGGTYLDLNSSLDGVLGFEVLVPDLLPPGFELVDAVTFSVPASFTSGAESFLAGGDWVRFLGTDGIESVTFAHGNTMSATAGFVQSSLRVVTEGIWEFGFGRVAGVSFVVAGRVPANDLRRLVESAF